MTPKRKEDLCVQIHSAGRQLFLSSRITEVYREKGTRKQLEFLLELRNEELVLREENRRKRLIQRAGFPVYKTFEGYSYQNMKFPPAFGQEELEQLEFIPIIKTLCFMDRQALVRPIWRLLPVSASAAWGIKQSFIR